MHARAASAWLLVVVDSDCGDFDRSERHSKQLLHRFNRSNKQPGLLPVFQDITYALEENVFVEYNLIRRTSAVVAGIENSPRERKQLSTEAEY